MKKERLELKREDLTKFIQKKLSKDESILASIDHIFTKREADYVNKKNNIINANINYKIYATEKRILILRNLIYPLLTYPNKNQEPFLLTEHAYSEVENIFSRKVNLLLYKEKTWSFTLIGGLLIHLSTLGIITELLFESGFSYLSMMSLGVGLSAVLFSLICESIKKYRLYYIITFGEDPAIAIASKKQEEVYYFINTVIDRIKQIEKDKRKKLAKKLEQQNPLDPHTKLKEYIKLEKKAGKTRFEIEDNLIHAGWKEEIIKKYIKKEEKEIEEEFEFDKREIRTKKQNKKQTPKMKLLKPRFCYLIDEESFERAINIFNTHVKAGSRGLIISRQNPRVLREKYNLTGKLIWLTDIGVEGSVEPSNFELIFGIMKDFLEEDDGVILFDGLVYLVNHKGFNSTLNLIQDIRDLVSTKYSRLIFPVNLNMLNEIQRQELKRELEFLHKKESFGEGQTGDGFF